MTIYNLKTQCLNYLKKSLKSLQCGFIIIYFVIVKAILKVLIQNKYNQSHSMKPYFPDIYQTQLRQKYHSAKIKEIENKKRSSSLLSQKRNSLSSKKFQPKILQERKIAMQNIEMIKRLAELKYGSSQIKKLWGSVQKDHLKIHKRPETLKQERQRLVQNERLGKVIQKISKRKKNHILPDE